MSNRILNRGGRGALLGVQFLEERTNARLIGEGWNATRIKGRELRIRPYPLPLGECLAHDRLRFAEAFAPVEADCTRVACRDVELDDRLANALRPLARVGQ
jgi:hypothetical protein